MFKQLVLRSDLLIVTTLGICCVDPSHVHIRLFHVMGLYYPNVVVGLKRVDERTKHKQC